jgi:hypothetical protein
MCAVLDDREADIGADDAALNALLEAWHRWASDERTAVGFPSVSPAFQQYRTSRQYDDGNGALDQDVDNVVLAGVEGCINSIPQPYRNALHINARNLCTGLSVWRSPRLPEDELARALMVSDARAMLIDILRERGLL